MRYPVLQVTLLVSLRKVIPCFYSKFGSENVVANTLQSIDGSLAYARSSTFYAATVLVGSLQQKVLTAVDQRLLVLFGKSFNRMSAQRSRTTSMNMRITIIYLRGCVPPAELV